MRYTVTKTVEYIQVIEAASPDAAEEVARNNPDNWEHLNTEIFADDEPLTDDCFWFCPECQERIDDDGLPSKSCPTCGGDMTKATQWQGGDDEDEAPRPEARFLD
jgi:rubrerythrin